MIDTATKKYTFYFIGGDARASGIPLWTYFATAPHSSGVSDKTAMKT